MHDDLIAELRQAANRKRDDLAHQSAHLFDRAADALESATKDRTAALDDLARAGQTSVTDPAVGGTEKEGEGQ